VFGGSGASWVKYLSADTLVVERGPFGRCALTVRPLSVVYVTLSSLSADSSVFER